MLYFADRFDEVPVRSLVKTKHFSNRDIPCIINHLCFPSKQIPQDRASKMTIKNSVYTTFSRTVCKREFLHKFIVPLDVLHVSPSYLDLGYYQVCFQS